MARVLYRKIRSRRLYANQAAFRRSVQEGMRKDVAPLVTLALAKRVSTWNTEIGFEYRMSLDSKGVGLHVFPTGEGAKFWRWVSRGVAGHPIRPKKMWSPSTKGRYRAKLTLYRYSPKTTPGGGYGGTGFRQFSGYRAYVPWWPGIAARLFEEHAARELRVPYRRTMENIMRRAVRAAKRAAT